MNFKQRSIWESKSIRVEPQHEEEEKQQQNERFEKRKTCRNSQ